MKVAIVTEDGIYFYEDTEHGKLLVDVFGGSLLIQRKYSSLDIERVRLFEPGTWTELEVR